MSKKGKSSVPSSSTMPNNLSDKPPPSRVIHCMDGEILDVDFRCCYESELIATLYYLDLVHYAMIKFPINILSLVVNDFCIPRFEIFEAYAHDDRLYTDMLEDFDVKFLQKHPPQVLEEVMHAADYLKIASLFNMTHFKLFGKLPNETPNWKKKGKSDLTRAGWDEVMKRISFWPENDLDNSRDAALRYRCMDGKIVNVDPRCCYESEDVQAELIQTEVTENDNHMEKYWGAKVGDIGRFPINAKIPSKFVSIVNSFCMSHFYLMERYGDDDNLFSDMLEFFDCCFIRSKPLYSLVQLMQAAYGMRIKSLFYLTRDAIIDRFDEKPANIIKIYNLPDFNHEVWQESWLSYAKGWPHGKNDDLIV